MKEAVENTTGVDKSEAVGVISLFLSPLKLAIFDLTASCIL